MSQAQVAQQQQEEKMNNAHPAVVMQPVESSNIKAVGYCQPTRDLFVTFKDGNTYMHKEVPQDIYDNMIDADSVGSFYHANVKGKFESVKNPETAAAPVPENKPLNEQDRARIANTQYKVHLTLQVITPILATIPDEELKEYILRRSELGPMKPSEEFLHKFASRLDDIVALVNAQVETLNKEVKKENVPVQGESPAGN
jgi:hypothetical protein